VGRLIAADGQGSHNRSPRYLVRDRDAAYGRDFVERARGLGIETLLTPIRAPRANAVAERLVGTLRRECLDRMIILNEAHLRAVLTEYAAFYNAERPHRALELGTPIQRIRPAHGPIRASPVLGGLHHTYQRVA
jgi:transposase InsO family protein